MVVEGFSHRPVAAWYDDDAQRHETTWWDELLNLLPVSGLLVVDLGFFGFEWFDAMTTANKYFLTRQKLLCALSGSEHALRWDILP